MNYKYKRPKRSHRTTLRLMPKYLNAYIYKFIKYLIRYTASCFLFSNYFYLGLTGSRDKAVNLMWVAAQKG